MSYISPERSVAYCNRVFVYGTLRVGQGNYHRLQLSKARHLGTETHVIPYTMYDLGSFPALFQLDEVEDVTGDLFEVNAVTMYGLDMLEGYPNLYNRTVVTLPATDTHDTCQAWVYYMEDTPTGRNIVNNDWVNPVYEEEVEVL